MPSYSSIFYFYIYTLIYKFYPYKNFLVTFLVKNNVFFLNFVLRIINVIRKRWSDQSILKAIKTSRNITLQKQLTAK